MKKIIGFFKVLFAIQKIYKEMDEQFKAILNVLDVNRMRHSDYDNRFMYLEKFTLSMRNKPLYEIGQTIFFNLSESAEKPKEENKLQGKILGIYAGHLFQYDKTTVSQVDYEFIYRVKKIGECCQNIYHVSESQIIM